MKNKVLIILIAILLTGCSATRIKKLSGEEFEKLMEKSGLMNSMCWVQYIGASYDRVYIEIGSVPFFTGENKVTIWWTYISELSEELSTRISQEKSCVPHSDINELIEIFNVEPSSQ